MASLVVSALSTWSNKGLKKAEKDVSAFDKTVKNLAKSFAAVFSAQAIFNFGKASVKAFMADEKAAKSLETQLNNLGFSYSAPGVELYIANLQKMYGVMDDQLRPAFQTLITASGSLTQSQKALDVALNVSAATGRSVEEVSAALAKGFTGQTTALSRLGAGLDKTILATGDMNKIMDALSTKFSGQATARLSTYAGQMDRLSVAAANAQEIIGKGLLDSLALFSKDNSIENAAADMETFAQAIADATFGMAKLLSKVETLTGLDKVKTQDLLAFVNLPAYLLSKYGATERNKPTSNFTYSLGAGAASEIAAAKQAKLDRDKLRIQQQLLAVDKAKLALSDLAKKFDTERIGLQLALNNATDEETKLRLKAQLALLDNNDALAKKYNAELEAAQKAKELADSLKSSTDALIKYGAGVSELASTLNSQNKALQDEKIGKNSYVSSAPNAGTAYVPFTGSVDELAGTLNFINKNAQDEKMGKNSYVINIDASNMVDSDRMTDVVQQAFLSIQRQGGSLSPAGSLSV